MTSDRPFYGLAKFSEGMRLLIRDRTVLDEFARTWKFHHRLEREQFEYAGRAAKVEAIFMYHCGDILYELQDMLGLWHQHLLKAAP